MVPVYYYIKVQRYFSCQRQNRCNHITNHSRFLGLYRQLKLWWLLQRCRKHDYVVVRYLTTLVMSQHYVMLNMLSFSGTGVSSFNCVPSNDVLVMAIW